jgi:hypothetical protein
MFIKCRQIMSSWYRHAYGNQGCQIFLVQHSKRGKVHQMTIKNTKWPKNIPYDRKIDYTAIKYTKISHCKTIQNLPKSGFLV